MAHLLEDGVRRAGLSAALLGELLRVLKDARVLCAADQLAATTHRYGDNPQSGRAPLPIVQQRAAAARRSIAAPDAQLEAGPVSPLREIALRRRSARGFDRTELSEEDLARVMGVAYSGAVKATPSAGALYPCSVYVYLRAGDEWQLLEWEPRGGRFVQSPRSSLAGARSPILRHTLDSDDLVGSAAALVVLSIDLADLTAKYGNRGYRFAMIEVGQIGQMIHLAVAEQDVGSHEWGAFRDRRLSQLLRLSRTCEVATVIALGRPGRDESPPASEAAQARLRAWQESTPGAPATVVSQEPQVRGRPTFMTVQQTEAEPRDVNVLSTGADWTTGGAYTRAMCEAIERRSSSSPRVDIVGTSRQLPEGVVVARDCLPALDLPAYGAPHLFEPYDDERSYEWVIGQRRDSTRVALPVELVGTQIALGRPLCGRASSSGVAAGATLADAQRSSFFELVERDAFVRCWVEQTPPARWASLPRWFDEVTSWTLTGEERITAHVFDAGIPTVGVAIRSAIWPALTFGMATRDRPEDALEKALQEAVAAHVSLAGMRDDVRRAPMVPSSPRGHALHYADPHALAAVDWFFDGPEVRTLPGVATRAVDGLADRLVRFDLTPEGSPVHVVRTVSPDLAPIWFSESFRDSRAPVRPPHFFA